MFLSVILSLIDERRKLLAISLQNLPLKVGYIGCKGIVYQQMVFDTKSIISLSF